MKKQQEKKQQELSGATALNFVENLEARISQMEKGAAEIWQNCYIRRTENELFRNWTDYELKEHDRKLFEEDALSRIKGYLRRYNLPCWGGQSEIRQEDVENLAYRIRLQKFAERLADRYGIELN